MQDGRFISHLHQPTALLDLVDDEWRADHLGHDDFDLPTNDFDSDFFKLMKKKAPQHKLDMLDDDDEAPLALDDAPSLACGLKNKDVIAF